VEGLEPLRLPSRESYGVCGVRILIKEAIGYGAASAGALVVDMTILWVLVRFFGWGYLAAATASFLAGAVVAYVLSLKLAFKQHRLRDQRVEFISFVAIGTVGLAVNAGVISLAVRYLGLHYLLAKCVAAGFTFMCNFFVRRQILFVRHSPV
jgi:putative flippase GtrA